MMISTLPKLALLIDADNAPSYIIEELLKEVAKYGTASVKRIYGNWTTPNMASWKSTLLEHSIHPIQQFAYTTGKNATDSAMIIDAMDLLHSKTLDGFCIVSSDSDFTRLATRLREDGRTVYGFGEKKTPQPFIKACDKFIYIENLSSDLKKNQINNVKNTPTDVSADAAQNSTQNNHVPLKLLKEVVASLADESGQVDISTIGQKINDYSSDFDPRSYGYKKLSDVFRAYPNTFDFIETSLPNGKKRIYIKLGSRKG